MTTSADRANSHNPLVRAEGIATNAGQRHGDDRPTNTPTIRDRRCRKATEETCHAKASRKGGTRVETVERSQVRHCHSLNNSSTKRVVHNLPGFTQNCLKVCFALKTLRINLVDVFRARRPCST